MVIVIAGHNGIMLPRCVKTYWTSVLGTRSDRTIYRKALKYHSGAILKWTFAAKCSLTIGLEVLGVSQASFSSMLCDILPRVLPHEIVVNYQWTCALQAANSAEDSTRQFLELDRLLEFCTELESLEKSDFGGHRKSDKVTHPEGESRHFCSAIQKLSPPHYLAAKNLLIQVAISLNWCSSGRSPPSLTYC